MPVRWAMTTSLRSCGRCPHKMSEVVARWTIFEGECICVQLVRLNRRKPVQNGVDVRQVCGILL